MKKYYLYENNIQQGPFDLDDLKAKKITPETYTWYHGIGEWTRAGEIEELQPLFLVAPPPFTHSSSVPSNPAPGHYYPAPAQSRNNKKWLFAGTGVLAAACAFWLFYNNNAQASELASLKEEQMKFDSNFQQMEDEKKQKEEERKRINEALTVKNRNFRNNWPEYISANPNRYRYSELGGIYGLEVIVSNNTDYLLDYVVATVKYIKANGDVWRTVEVPVDNVPPHGEKRYSLADVERCTSVEVDIQSIRSGKMHFCYTQGGWSGNGEDPYFCK